MVTIYYVYPRYCVTHTLKLDASLIINLFIFLYIPHFCNTIKQSVLFRLNKYNNGYICNSFFNQNGKKMVENVIKIKIFDINTNKA